jgi:acyl-CoA thioesterase
VTKHDTQRIAEAVGERMFADDRASRSLGMQLAHIAPGAATMTMRVRADMLNGMGICHGGLITTLADSAFAFACNAGNELTVAASLAIDFLAPAREGDLLTAKAAEVSQSGRNGVYDVSVTNERGELVAIFRGRSHRVRGKPSVAT